MKLDVVRCAVFGETSLILALFSQRHFAPGRACTRPVNMSCWRGMEEPWGKAPNENESATVMYENPTMKFITQYANLKIIVKNNNRRVLAHRERGSLIIVGMDSSNRSGDNIYISILSEEIKFGKIPHLKDRNLALALGVLLTVCWGRSVCNRKPQCDSSVLPPCIADGHCERKGICLV